MKIQPNGLDMTSIPLESVDPQDITEWNNNIPHLQRFNDFKTIDWVNDNLQHHKRKLLLTQKTTKRHITKFKLLNIYQSLQSYIILTVVGILIGFVAGSLNIVTEYLSNIRTGYCSSHLYLNRNFCCWGELEESKCTDWVHYSTFPPFNYIMYILISLLLGSTSCLLVLNYAKLAAGSGISEIKCIVSGFTLSGFLSAWTFLMKAIGLPLAIASGLSVGKEGPSVHYAVCVGSIVSKLFLRTKYGTSNEVSKTSSSLTFKSILVASSAAGVAVAFGSPMGGVLFSIEEISNMFKLSTMWESYYCSLVAVFILKLMNPFRTGQVVMFEVSYDQDWHFFEIPFFIVLGVFGGVYGIVISKFNIKMVSFRKKFLTNFALKEVIYLVLITSMISYFNDFLKMDMTEGMQILFEACNDQFENHKICNLTSSYKISNTLFTLFIATLIRTILIVFTYGCKVPAGIFVPSMACGATFGRALGIIVQIWHQRHPNFSYFTTGCLADNSKCITPGTYAFLGAGAALSGITHLTVTVVVIMFELTGALKYIIPTMITVSVTKIINDNFGKGGIADQMIEFNGLPFIDPHGEHDFFEHQVKEAMTKRIVSIPQTGISYRQLLVILNDTDFQTFPIIKTSESPIIKGIIGRDEIRAVIDKAQAKAEISLDSSCHFDTTASSSKENTLNFQHYINRAPLTVELNTPLETVLDLFHKLGPKSILIEAEGKLQGLMTRKDILKYEYYLHHGADFTSEDLKFERDDFIWENFTKFDVWISNKYEQARAKITSSARNSNYIPLNRNE